MLVDAGPAKAYLRSRRVYATSQPPGSTFSCSLMSHADHIEGLILLATDRDLALDIGDVWYNGERQMGMLGPVAG